MLMLAAVHCDPSAEVCLLLHRVSGRVQLQRGLRQPSSPSLLMAPYFPITMPCMACTWHSHFLKFMHCEQHELDVRRAIACATMVSA